jgi:hypothetical protein
VVLLVFTVNDEEDGDDEHEPNGGFYYDVRYFLSYL